MNLFGNHSKSSLLMSTTNAPRFDLYEEDDQEEQITLSGQRIHLEDDYLPKTSEHKVSQRLQAKQLDAALEANSELQQRQPRLNVLARDSEIGGNNGGMESTFSQKPFYFDSLDDNNMERLRNNRDEMSDSQRDEKEIREKRAYIWCFGKNQNGELGV